MQFTCHQCGQPCEKKPSDHVQKGRPWKHTFCNQECYDRWRAERHLEVKAQWLRFQREVWGTVPIERHRPAGAREYARQFEEKARLTYLPQLGFTEIVDLSAMSNQFFVDFVATFKGRRVLVDATVKLKAYVPEKVGLANALRMRLFIIHVAPGREGLFHLNEVRGGRVVSRVPAALIREHAELRAAELPPGSAPA